MVAIAAYHQIIMMSDTAPNTRTANHAPVWICSQVPGNMATDPFLFHPGRPLSTCARAAEGLLVAPPTHPLPLHRLLPKLSLCNQQLHLKLHTT